METGFDMNTQEGVAAFQAQYNQQIRATGTPPMPLPGIPSIPRPGEPLSLEGLSDDVPLESLRCCWKRSSLESQSETATRF